MNQPQKPQDPPAAGAPSDANPAGNTPAGIPDGMEEHDAKGLPTSDRHDSELAPKV